MKKNQLNLSKFNILYDNVLVKGIHVDEVDGVLIPASYEDKPEIGEVLKIGTGRVFDNGTIIPLSIKIGDIVYFNKYTHTKFRWEGQDYYVVREEDIVAYSR